VFATTTCLDHAHLLARAEMRDLVCRRLAADIHRYDAVLHAFCILSNHLHLLIRAPNNQTISWFMQRFKSNAAKDLHPLLNEFERSQVHSAKAQERIIFERSFNGPPIRDERMFWAVSRYIHLNPVRANQSKSTLTYRWSSAAMYERCEWNDETGINAAIKRMWPDDPPEWAHRRTEI